MCKRIPGLDAHAGQQPGVWRVHLHDSGVGLLPSASDEKVALELDPLDSSSDSSICSCSTSVGAALFLGAAGCCGGWRGTSGLRPPAAGAEPGSFAGPGETAYLLPYRCWGLIGKGPKEAVHEVTYTVGGKPLMGAKKLPGVKRETVVTGRKRRLQ